VQTHRAFEGDFMRVLQAEHQVSRIGTGDQNEPAGGSGAGPTRRGLIVAGAALAAGGLIAPTGADASSRMPEPPEAELPVDHPGPTEIVDDVLGGLSERKLSLFNVHTGEWVSSVYWRDGQYVERSLQWIDWLMRDWRENAIVPVARPTLDILCALTRLSRTESWIHVTSGYRTPRTNRMLARSSNRVAPNSLHLQARAIDFTIPETQLGGLRSLALDLGAGGVGYYPRNHFIHIDNGQPRTWIG
jgi:uncharacterized protein YcbK (DUF882 family)